MVNFIIPVIIGLVLSLATNAQNQNAQGQSNPHRRFEYKYSFKPPYLAQKDGTVPFFEYSGRKLFWNFSHLSFHGKFGQNNSYFDF